MALTASCDLYAAVHEDGVNRVIQHIMRQRPSWFNYGTDDVAANRELWCASIDYTKDVTTFNNPLFTVMQPLPVIGSSNPQAMIGFCAQLTKAAIDFHPGNKITLPPQLNPPLKPQCLSLQFRVCGGLVCPSDKEIEQIPIGVPAPKPSPPTHETTAPPTVPPIVLHGRPICFCLDVFAVCHFEIASGGLLMGKVDGMEIVDVKPDGLESNLECYLRTAVSIMLREKLTISLKSLSLSFPLFDMGTITLIPTPNPPVPNNPAIEEDQLKAFITMTP
jgi:hypothetical protein